MCIVPVFSTAVHFFSGAASPAGSMIQSSLKWIAVLLSLLGLLILSFLGGDAGDSDGNYITFIELSHDWNVFYDQTLHQSAITCVQYDDRWFNTG